ncbi:hypothetical protein DMUE_4094 [Dictyocoela muelleri]|nr:hypothetical protein DMUE_4094 [Dictyocoela muelleri]
MNSIFFLVIFIKSELFRIKLAYGNLYFIRDKNVIRLGPKYESAIFEGMIEDVDVNNQTEVEKSDFNKKEGGNRKDHKPENVTKNKFNNDQKLENGSNERIKLKEDKSEAKKLSSKLNNEKSITTDDLKSINKSNLLGEKSKSILKNVLKSKAEHSVAEKINNYSPLKSKLTTTNNNENDSENNNDNGNNNDNENNNSSSTNESELFEASTKENSFFSTLKSLNINQINQNLKSENPKFKEKKGNPISFIYGIFKIGENPDKKIPNKIFFKLHQNPSIMKTSDVYLTVDENNLVIETRKSRETQGFKIRFISKDVFHLINKKECLEYDEINEVFVKNTCNDTNKYQLFRFEKIKNKQMGLMFFGTRGSYRKPNPLYKTGYNPVLHGFHGPRGILSFPSALFS